MSKYLGSLQLRPQGGLFLFSDIRLGYCFLFTVDQSDDFRHGCAGNRQQRLSGRRYQSRLLCRNTGTDRSAGRRSGKEAASEGI